MTTLLPLSEERQRLVDGTIVFLLLYLCATLPFAVADFAFPFFLFNRGILVLVGALCALSVLSKRSFQVRPGTDGTP